MENISDYINIKNIVSYPNIETKTEKLWETKDLIKRAKKKWYSYKEIKELNPWILWNVLPKGRWEIEVYAQ
jgi:radical SAM superfamily enzyme with C-terminal helix-hairpin-helix motif